MFNDGKNPVENFPTAAIDPLSEEEERKHFIRIIKAFNSYKAYATNCITRRLKFYNQLSDRHKALIPNFETNMEKMQECVDKNYAVIKAIISDCGNLFLNVDSSSYEKAALLASTASGDCVDSMSMERVKTTLKQFVRDWSSAGREERELCYKPIINAITQRFPADTCDRGDVYVLVPGVGLGRLAFDIASLGYACQGNECSLFMLLASNYAMNRNHEPNSQVIYPWITNFCNNITIEDQMKEITFPDVDTRDFYLHPKFSMAAGDFLDVYAEKDIWDCVVTCFFIDTANNILAYIETIFKILKPGGYWINLGPLLYHFSDMPNELSIELCYSEVKQAIRRIGFIYEEEKIGVPTTYLQNSSSMLKYEYESVFFVVRKPFIDGQLNGMH